VDSVEEALHANCTLSQYAVPIHVEIKLDAASALQVAEQSMVTKVVTKICPAGNDPRCFVLAKNLPVRPQNS